MESTELKVLSGWIQMEEDENCHDSLFLRNDGSDEEDDPLADRLDFMNRRQVTVRYWIAEKRCTKEEASEDLMGTLMGRAESDFGARYSEYTGYLWTDENIDVGGHDLLSELRGYNGQFLILEIELH